MAVECWGWPVRRGGCVCALLAFFGVWGLCSRSGAAVGRTVSDPFDGPGLPGWEGLRPCWRLSGQPDGASVAELGGPSEEAVAATRILHMLKGEDWENYLVGVTVRKLKGHWAGLIVRRSATGYYEICLNEARGIMVRRQPNAVVLARTHGSFPDGQAHRLEVAAIGPFLRVFVNGELHLSVSDRHSPRGRSGLMGHLVHAQFDDYVQTLDMPVERAVLAAPAEEAGAFVFSPGEPVRLPIDLWGTNAARDAVTVRADLDVTGGGRLSLSGSVKLPAGPRETVELAPPALPEGLHLAALSVECDGVRLPQGSFPVGIWALPKEAAPGDGGFFPVGVYDKFRLSGNGTFTRTYLHAICHDLRGRGLNTLLTGGVIRTPTVELLDICNLYGVKVVLRIDAPADDAVMRHPAVICCMLGDEPKLEQLDAYKQRYAQMAEGFPGLPVVSCLVGESAGTGAANNPLRIWWELEPELRLVRFYPIRKRSYGLLRPPVYKRHLPFAAAMGAFGGSFDSPWWYVVQTFGGEVTDEKPDPYWRNPTGPELTGMIHTALAYGARGILCYAYQRESKSWTPLVEQETLQPCDGKLVALSAVARLIEAHKELLVRLRFGGFEARTDRPEVLAVPQKTDHGRAFVYLINLDASRQVATNVDLVRGEATSVHSLYREGRAQVDRTGPYPRFGTALAPGEGQLWELLD